LFQLLTQHVKELLFLRECLQIKGIQALQFQTKQKLKKTYDMPVYAYSALMLSLGQWEGQKLQNSASKPLRYCHGSLM